MHGGEEGLFGPGVRLGSYEIERLVGRGGGGNVYRARTTAAGPAGEAGSVVALKVFHPELISDERIFQRFQREAELGMRIRHGHVVRTFEAGVADADGTPCHFMAMEFVRGETLRDTLDQLGSMPDHLLYPLADQVLDALSAVHAEGMIHRDLKPENIVVAEDQHVRLMDLGVARLQQEGRDLTRAGEFVGSLAYAAPEQFTDQDHVDPRADLYAFGVLLYELATGHNPFDEPDLSALLMKKLRGQVRRPKSLNRELDPFLDEVILTCLQSDPAARFESCEALRAVLREGEAGAWWRERAEGEAFAGAVRALRRIRPPRDAPLLGRAAELERLHEAFEDARGGQGAVALVTGAAGVGKSRLVHDFLEDLAAPDGPFVGVGLCGGGSDPVAEAVRGLLPDGEAMDERLGELLQDAAAAGALSRHLLGDDALPEAERAPALAALLGALAGTRPLVLAFEDLQRADAPVVALFGDLLRELAERPVLLVATWRPEEVEEGSPLHALQAAQAQRRECRALSLAPLGREAADELLGALVGVPRTVRALSWPLFRASDGNPHFLIESVAHLKETGALVKGDDGWTPGVVPSEIALPASLRELVAARLEGLEEEGLRLLEAASVQGTEFEASVLQAVSGEKRIRLLKLLAGLERKHRLIVSAGKSSFRFATRGLRRVVYEGMREERRRELHSLCADAIGDAGASLAGPEAMARVRHLLQAGRAADARTHLAAAVDHAATASHAAEGLAFLRRLLFALPEEDPAARCEVLLRLSDLQRLRGAAEESGRALAQAEEAADRSGAAGLRGRVLFARAQAALGAGDGDEAGRLAERALSLGAGDPGVEAACRTLLGDAAFRRGDFPGSADAWRKALEVARAAGDRRGEAEALLRLGVVMPETGEGGDALATKQEALALFREIGDRRGEGIALNNVGNALADAGRVPEAEVCFEQSARVARDLGNLPALATALYNQARIFTIEARIDRAKECFDKALDIFREIGDPAGEAQVLDETGAALAAFGDADRALGCLVQAREVVERTGDHVLLARILRHLGTVRHEAGEREGAWEDFDRALGLAGARTRAGILSDMGRAAEREGDFDRAAKLFQESLGPDESGARTLLSLCRLARAHLASGRLGEARAFARRAEALADGEHGVDPQHAPEVFYTLGMVLGEDGRRHLERANELVGARTRSIRSVVYRQHYLTTRWPNREILEEARRLRES